MKQFSKVYLVLVIIVTTFAVLSSFFALGENKEIEITLCKFFYYTMYISFPIMIALAFIVSYVKYFKTHGTESARLLFTTVGLFFVSLLMNVTFYANMIQELF